MRVILTFFILCIWSSATIAQRPSLKLESGLDWPYIQNVKISSNGLFCMYEISNERGADTLYVQSLSQGKIRKIAHSTGVAFTSDSRWVIIKSSEDSVSLLNLAKGTMEYFLNVSDLQYQKSGPWVAFRKDVGEPELILFNLVSCSRTRIPSVETFQLSPNGHLIVFVRNGLSDSLHQKTLVWMDLSNMSQKEIWSGNSVDFLKISNDNSKLTFLSTSSAAPDDLNLNLYETGLKRAISFKDKLMKKFNNEELSKDPPGFSDDSRNLYFFYKSKKKTLKNERENRLLILRSDDAILYPTPGDKKYVSPYLAFINLQSDRNVIKVEDSVTRIDENGVRAGLLSSYADNHVIVVRGVAGYTADYKWRNGARPDVLIKSTVDGQEKVLRRQDISSKTSFTPTGKYIYWFDRVKGRWIVFNRLTNDTVDICTNIKRSFTKEIDIPLYGTPRGACYWVNDDSNVIIQDRYDVWMVDPEGKKKPLSITGGIGKSRGIRFEVLSSLLSSSLKGRSGDTLYLSAFDVSTKRNAIISYVFGGQIDLNKISLNDAVYFFGYNRAPALPSEADVFVPIKADSAAAFLLKKMTSTQYPNLYYTNDFNHLHQLTSLKPESSFNWYTTELLHWKSLDGSLSEGVLYKPQDFSPQKKYPLIIYVYERSDEGLNVYVPPYVSTGSLNIPWFVSNGYLVLFPSINYKIGAPGESAYDAVESACRYLSKMPWIDSGKIGLQGHSFGAYETNYIVTRTKRFAAAAPSDGVSDMISALGQYWLTSSKHSFIELSQSRMGKSLWEVPEKYIKNSPIFFADKVTTPLLISHGKEDGTVYLSQGMEWFSALRRLGKRAWFLEYMFENHGLIDKGDKIDYSNKLMEFFDHFLKNCPMPDWMK